ncbi:putative transcription factor WD40-like family [Helianthus debilis subsp. tardiflorus]
MKTTPASLHDLSSSSSSTSSPPHRNRNVFQMLTRREIAPRIKKHVPRRHRGRNFDLNHRRYVKPNSESARDSRRELLSWVETESLGWLSAKYCSLMPSPRSTIAAAFSPDGKILASTHGDHTVKIIDCQTGKCLKVLSGHRRTPWVVRFNPLHPEILASGSLDHEVRLWNANTSECIRSRDFYRPIASIAFHSEGELLAVAAGHKLYLWQYNSRGETSSPAIILRTRRSLRAVHFHPHAAPLLLTAEVNDLDSSDSTMAPATSQAYMHYPPPAVYMGNMHRIDRLSLAAELPLVPLQLMQTDGASASNMNISGVEDMGSSQSSQLGRDSGLDPLREHVRWELPFMQGWLMGQSQNQAGPPPTFPLGGSPHRYTVATEPPFNINLGQTNESTDGVDSIPMMNIIQSQISASLTATAAAELPCTVKLRIWSHDIKNPCALLKPESCRLVIPHAVLCSEMGAHFSPCGRYLAACVACVLPQFEADSGISTQLHQDVSRAGTSPTRHPISARHVIYELRVYSLEEATFGSVLISRPIRAAHCLTSVQFSPSSEHILLAYGRRHSSLLRSIDINGDTSLSIYTVLEVYRVSDMELVSVLPSAEDEVNVACFHPFSGGGIVYGTKEGKLRILQFNGARGTNITKPDNYLEAQMVDVE